MSLGGSVTLSLSASYVGQTSITTLGTITTGVWNGTVIANAYLANSSLTVSAGAGLATGGSVSLGGSVTLATDETYAHVWTGLHTYSFSTDSTSFASGAQAIKLATTASATDNTHHKASPWLGLTASIWTGSATVKLFEAQNQGVSGTTSAYQFVLQSTDVSSILLIRGDTGNISTSNNLAVGGTLTAGTYVGQTSIVTLGTITTGVWNGTVIANAYLANSSVTVTAGVGLSTGGSVSLGGSVTLDLTVPVTVAHGGTGATSWTSHGLIYASGTTTLTNSSNLTWDGNALIATAAVGSIRSVESGSSSAHGFYLSNTGSYDVYLFQANATNALLTGSAAGDFIFRTSANAIFTTDSGSHILMYLGSGNAGVSIGSTTVTSLFNVGTSAQFQINTSGVVVSGTWNGTAIANGYLANSSVTVSAGTGLSGGGSVSLGGSVTLSTAQDIRTSASPTFVGLTLSGTLDMSGGSPSQQLWLYKSGNHRFGFGTGTNTLQIYCTDDGLSPSPAVQIGTMSFADGATFTSYLTVDHSGTVTIPGSVVAGSFYGNLICTRATTSAAHSITSSEMVILANGSNLANNTITLPSASANTGKLVCVKLIANTTGLVKATETIDGVAGSTGYSLSAQYQAAWFLSDGANWWLVAKF